MESTICIPRSIFPAEETSVRSTWVHSNSNEKRLVTKSSANAAYVAPYLLFYRDQTLFGQLFDTKKFELTGEPIPDLTDIQYSPRISRSGICGYELLDLLVAQKAGDSGASQLLWFDRKGQQIGTALKPGIYGNICSVSQRQGRGVGYDRSGQPEHGHLDLRSRKPEREAADLRSRD